MTLRLIYRMLAAFLLELTFDTRLHGLRSTHGA